MSNAVNSGSATNGGLRRLRSSSSVHNGFAARYRCLSSPNEFSLQHKRSPALSKAPYSNPIFVLAQLGNWPVIGQHNQKFQLSPAETYSTLGCRFEPFMFSVRYN